MGLKGHCIEMALILSGWQISEGGIEGHLLFVLADGIPMNSILSPVLFSMKPLGEIVQRFWSCMNDLSVPSTAGEVVEVLGCSWWLIRD